MQKQKEGWFGIVITASICGVFLWWLFLEPSEDLELDPALIVQDAGKDLGGANLSGDQTAAIDFELLLLALIQEERGELENAKSTAGLASAETVRAVLATLAEEPVETQPSEIDGLLAEGQLEPALELAIANLTGPDRDRAVGDVLEAAVAQGREELVSKCIAEFESPLAKAVGRLQFHETVDSLERASATEMGRLAGVQMVDYLVALSDRARELLAEQHADAIIELANEAAGRLETAEARIGAFLALAANAYDRVNFEDGRLSLEQAHAAFSEEETIDGAVVERFVEEANRMGAQDLLDDFVARRAEGSPKCRAWFGRLAIARALASDDPAEALSLGADFPAALGNEVRESNSETPIPLEILFGSRVGAVRASVVFDPDEARYVAADGAAAPEELVMWRMVRDGRQRVAYQIAWEKEEGWDRALALLRFARMLYLAKEGDQ